MSTSPQHVLAFEHEDVVAATSPELVAHLIPLHAEVPEEFGAALRHDFALSIAEELQLRHTWSPPTTKHHRYEVVTEDG